MTRVSLPVKLFEPRSFLERISDNWAYIDLLLAASATSNPEDRMKYLVAFVVGGLRRQISFDKPFNPILGETCQGFYNDHSVEVFAEQICHHPPISAWQVVDKAGKVRL